MIKEILPKVRKVIELANNRKWEASNQENKFEINNANLDDFLTKRQHQQALMNYIFDLTYEEIEAIEAIMYLGRDKEYTENQRPEEILAEGIKYIRLSEGKGDKELAIEHITSKINLHTYLEDGLEILK